MDHGMTLAEMEKWLWIFKIGAKFQRLYQEPEKQGIFRLTQQEIADLWCMIVWDGSKT